MSEDQRSPYARSEQKRERPLPLSGVTVVAVEQAVAAPLATRHLADLGARVIKVEREGGGDFARAYDTSVLGQSSHFIWLNRGKESIQLDLKSDSGIGKLRELLARADVFVQNLGPGAAERIGCGADLLRGEYPRLIVASISGYGTSGPYHAKKAYDLLVQCETGVLATTGTSETPVKAGIPVGDIAAGTYTYSGVLAALYERERTGEGQLVEISMLDALTEWMGYPMYYTGYGGAPPARSGAHHAAIAPYGPCTVGDGTQVFLAVQNDREWSVLCTEILQDPALTRDERFATNSDRVAHRDELTALIESRLADRDADEVEALLDRERIANARLREVVDAAEHPQLVARDRFRAVDTPAGPVRALRPPMLNDSRETAMGPIPSVGEHTEGILRWLDDEATPSRRTS